MYVTIEAQDSFKLPSDCYLEVEVGGARQFTKFDQQCKVSLPNLLQGASAQRGKIDIYQKVGSCDVLFDASEGKAVTCNVSAQVPSMEGLRLSVSNEVEGFPHRSGGGLFECCTSSSVPATEQTMQLVKPTSVQQVPKETTRLLVFTDVGEEIDDEGALWLCRQHVKSTPHVEVDVVFVTGDPLQRATRWAQILNSADEPVSRVGKMSYFTGPQSDRHMRYRTFADVEVLRAAGMETLLSKSFEGGSYDAVLQLSPVWGFSSNFASPPAGTAGALGRIKPRPGSHCLLHIIVGGVGATNYPRDELHIGFHKTLNEKGFTTVHVEKSNYLNWDKGMFETFPPKLTEIILDDEWNKAVGRIPPFAANLLVRFRVNCNVNYDVVDRAYAAFEQELRGKPSLGKAQQWWDDVRSEVEAKIRHGYIKRSRDRDDKSGDVFGNHKISENVKGMKFTWESMMSRTCSLEAARTFAADQPPDARCSSTGQALASKTVDDIMHSAVCEMTGKLLRIYAFNRYTSGREPDIGQLTPYLDGTQDKAPLDFETFPELHGNISAIQKEVVGNPMYDPAGVLVGLMALGANAQQVKVISSKLEKKVALMDDESRVAAMKAAYLGETQEQLMTRLVDKLDVGEKRSVRSSATRVLLLTNPGEDADGEAALWLLSTHLAQMADVDVDVVFTTGKPGMRAMRWANVLNSVGMQNQRGKKNMHYFAGPETSAEFRYFIILDENELSRAGMQDLSESFFQGGEYNMIIQCSPLHGYSSEFSNPPSGPEGALARVSAASGTSRRPMYVVVGDEGATNFPSDDLHKGFRAFMIKQGFSVMHVTESSYTAWAPDMLPCLPSTLGNLALQDEWRKAAGRIPPSKANLFLRFRVNTDVNYEVIDAAYRSFAHTHQADSNFEKSLAWWSSVSSEVKQCIMDSYIKASRDADKTSYGNPPIRSEIAGKQSTWRSTMSESCVRDILASTQMTETTLLDRSVDEVMCLAVTELTGKLLQIYAFLALDAKVTPSKELCLAYVSGSSENPPLDFYQFPRLVGDLSNVKKQVLGNPMYDTSGVLLSLCLLTGTAEQREQLREKVSSKKPWLAQAEKKTMLCSAFRGEPVSGIIEKLCGSKDQGGSFAFASDFEEISL